MASQMAPAVFDTTTVDFLIDGNEGKKSSAEPRQYLFRSTGSIVKFEGFLTLYREAHEEGDGRALEDEQALPEVALNERIPVKEIVPKQHFTEPPARFSEASLVKELERLGIGRPSTYASIISVLADRHYVLLEQRRFTPTPLGETVAKIMVMQFPDIFNVEFTSGMEGELDKVEAGSMGWQRVLEEFWDPFLLSLNAANVEELIAQAHDLSVLETERCPKDGGKLVAKGGILRPVSRVRESSRVHVHAPARPRSQAGRDDYGGLSRVRQVHGDSSGSLGRVPRLQRISEVPRHARDAHGNQVPEGRRRHHPAPLEARRPRVLRLRESPGVRLHRLEQAGSRGVPGLPLHGRRDEVHQGARRLSQMHEVRQ